MPERFILQKSEKPNHWVVTDTELDIVGIFENGKFNETQKFNMLNDTHPGIGKITQSMREIGEWLLTNHPEKV